MSSCLTDTIILGGGYAGLYSLRSCVDEGVDALLLEGGSDIGGQWRYGVRESTECVSSKLYMSASDFPMPDAYPEFPSAQQVFAHLHRFTQHFNLWSRIRLNSRVLSVAKVNDLWYVNLANKQYTAYRLVVATGANSMPKFPTGNMFDAFTGLKMHSSEYRGQCNSDFVNKDILVVGTSDTASDIAHELADFGRVTVSSRRGLWFQPKSLNRFAKAFRVKGVDKLSDDVPSDMISSRLIIWYKQFMFWCYGPRFLEDTGYIRRIERAIGKTGSDIPEFESKVNYLSSIWTKSTHLIDDVRSGKIVAKKSVVEVDGNAIRFMDDEKDYTFDAIIFCTGFSPKFNIHFGSLSPSPKDAYRWIFDCDDPSLAFVGFARPIVTGFPLLIEMQARYVAAVASGKLQLPSIDKRKQIQKSDLERMTRRFYAYASGEIAIVDPYDYVDQLMDDLRLRPNYLRLLMTEPRMCLDILFGSYAAHIESLLTSASAEKRHLARLQFRQLHEHPTNVLARLETYLVFRGCAKLLVKSIRRRIVVCFCILLKLLGLRRELNDTVMVVG